MVASREIIIQRGSTDLVDYIGFYPELKETALSGLEKVILQPHFSGRFSAVSLSDNANYTELGIVPENPQNLGARIAVLEDLTHQSCIELEEQGYSVLLRPSILRLGRGRDLFDDFREPR